MNNKQSQKQKWISEAAYYKSLERLSKPGMEKRDWFEAEQEFKQLLNQRIKSGLVRIDETLVDSLT